MSGSFVWSAALIAVAVIWLGAVFAPAQQECAKRHGTLVRGYTLSGLACVAQP